MFEKLLKWIKRHELATIIISSIIGSLFGLLVKDLIKTILGGL